MNKPQEFTLFIANNQGGTPRITCIDNHLYIEEEVKQLGTIFKVVEKSAYDKAIKALKLYADECEYDGGLMARDTLKELLND